MEASDKNKFNKRAFISTGLFISALGLPLSGIINHVFQFDPMTVERHFWMSVHNVSAVLTTIFFLFHLANNRGAIVKYIRKTKEARISREAAAAMILVVFFVGLISSHAFHVR